MPAHFQTSPNISRWSFSAQEKSNRADLRVGLAHPTNSALGALTDDLLKKLALRDKVYAAKRSQPIVNADAGHVLVNQMRVGALDVIVVYRSNALSHSDNPDQFLEIVDMNIPEAVARALARADGET